MGFTYRMSHLCPSPRLAAAAAAGRPYHPRRGRWVGVGACLSHHLPPYPLHHHRYHHHHPRLRGPRRARPRSCSRRDGRACGCPRGWPAAAWELVVHLQQQNLIKNQICTVWIKVKVNLVRLKNVNTGTNYKFASLNKRGTYTVGYFLFGPFKCLNFKEKRERNFGDNTV